MGTITNKNSQDIIEPEMDKIISFAEKLERQGLPRDRILKIVNAFKTAKVNEFYQKQEFKNYKIDFVNILSPIREEINKADSKAEKILYTILKENDIEFKFQVKIGHYRVDYLIKDFVVLEADGPHHVLQREKDANRDKYLKNLGYDVWRFTWDEISAFQDTIVVALKEL